MYKVVAASANSQSNHSNEKLDREFQSAVAQYDAGRFAEAAVQLENLLPYAPKSFEIQELLGLVYAAQSQDAKALEHLEIAARLKPDSAAAHTNLAAALFHNGDVPLAREQFSKALALAPDDYDANHNLGELDIESGKIAEARPLLEKAQKINPSSYDNGYDLAQAYFLTGDLAQAREVVESLLKQKNAGELHNLLGHVDEKDGKFVDAANQYEIAAHLDPSEQNLFDWGSEYLLHRTYEPAIEIFQQGSSTLSRIRRDSTLAWECLSIRGANTMMPSRLWSRPPISIPPTPAVTSFFPKPTTLRRTRRKRSSNASVDIPSCSQTTRSPSITTR